MTKKKDKLHRERLKKSMLTMLTSSCSIPSQSYLNALDDWVDGKLTIEELIENSERGLYLNEESRQALLEAKQGIGLSKPYTDADKMFDDILTELLDVTMTPEEFKTHMQKISKNIMELDDLDTDMPSMIEDAHIKADELMCEILTDLGYGEGIEIFKKMEKYYV